MANIDDATFNNQRLNQDRIYMNSKDDTALFVVADGMEVISMVNINGCAGKSMDGADL